MFNLFTRRKPLPELGLLEGMADVHSHLLPGVDDGMPDGASSYAACRWLESRGVRRVFPATAPTASAPVSASSLLATPPPSSSALRAST